MAESARLYLITPKLSAAEPFLPLLEAALAAADIACVLIRPADGDERALKALAGGLAPRIQAAGAAALILGEARLAARLGLDGVHVEGGGEALDAALESLKPDRIVGVGGVASRDDAMTAGERGADYLMFGFPGLSSGDVAEDTAWWAPLFTVPCVAYAETPDLAAGLARAGAEFVALCAGVWDAPEGPGAVLSAVARQLAQVAAEAVP